MISGWSIGDDTGRQYNLILHGEDDMLMKKVEKMFQMDFSESTFGRDLGMSLEDKKANTIMENSVKWFMIITSWIYPSVAM